MVFLVKLLFTCYKVSSQNVPFITSSCENCELNNLYQHTPKINFEGGNINCDRNFQLVFFDEFDGTTLDDSKWFTYYHPGASAPNHTNRLHENRGSYFKDENVSVANGICTLHTKVEPVEFPEVCFRDNCITSRFFTSGMLWSKPKFENFHRYEIRCNTPLGAGSMWTAFWIFGWSTEIDFFEFNSSVEPEFTVHKWFGNSQTYSTASGRMDLGSLVGSFHTYAVEHDKFFIRWYIDDVLVYTVSLFKNINNYPPSGGFYLPEGEYDKTMSFPDCNEPALSVIVDPGATPSAHPYFSMRNFPNDFLIDYIRVYKIVDNNEEIGCNISITGPTSICKKLDTLQYCLNGAEMKGGSWELPQGITMYQNPSLTITSKLVFIGNKDTIVFDTVINKDCIKVIASEYYGGGKVRYKVPEECKFLSGDFAEKSIYFGTPLPNLNYYLTCTSVTICLENPDAFTEVWYQQAEILPAPSNKNCKTFEVAFSKKQPYYYFTVQGTNECGSRINTIRLDGRNCFNTSGSGNYLPRFSILPNPASDYFSLKLNNIVDNVELSKIIHGQIIHLNSGDCVKTFNVNIEDEIFINSENFIEGEYLILLRDLDDKYYSDKLIINRN